jgi:hypothetical protein
VKSAKPKIPKVLQPLSLPNSFFETHFSVYIRNTNANTKDCPPAAAEAAAVNQYSDTSTLPKPFLAGSISASNENDYETVTCSSTGLVQISRIYAALGVASI